MRLPAFVAADFAVAAFTPLFEMPRVFTPYAAVLINFCLMPLAIRSRLSSPRDATPDASVSRRRQRRRWLMPDVCHFADLRLPDDAERQMPSRQPARLRCLPHPPPPAILLQYALRVALRYRSAIHT